MSDAEDEVGPRRFEPFARAGQDRNQLVIEDLLGDHAQEVVAHGARFEWQIQCLCEHQELVVVPLAMAEEHPDARLPHHARRNRRYRLPRCSIITPTLIAVASTRAMAAA